MAENTLPCRSDLQLIRNKIAVHESTPTVSTLMRGGLSVPWFWAVKVGIAKTHLGRLLDDISFLSSLFCCASFAGIIALPVEYFTASKHGMASCSHSSNDL